MKQAVSYLMPFMDQDRTTAALAPHRDGKIVLFATVKGDVP